MLCKDCQASTNVPPGGTTPTDGCNGNYMSSECVLYKGADLSTIIAETGDTLTQILIDIDNILSTIVAGSFTADNGLNNNVPTNVQLGGDLLKDTIVDGLTDFTMTFTSANNTNTEYTLYAINSSLVGNAFYASAVSGVAGVFSINHTTDDDIEPVIKIDRYSSNTPLIGIGSSIEFYIETDSGGISYMSNRIASKWEDVTTATRSSVFEIYGTNIGSNSRQFTILPTGQLIFDFYGVGNFIDTPVYSIGVDASGNIIEFDGTSLVTADNALTANTSTNVQLGSTTNVGSPLLHTSYINTTPAYQLIVNGDVPGTTANGTLYVINNSTASVLDKTIYATTIQGRAVHGEASTGVGLYGNSNSGNGIFANSSTGIAAYIQSGSGKALQVNTSNANYPNDITVTTAVNNTVLSNTIFSRVTNTVVPSADVGLGLSIDFKINTTGGSGSTSLSNKLISKWTNATLGSLSSEFILQGSDVSVIRDLLTISGNGATKLNRYGSGTFTGTSTYNLGVDATGNVIETLAIIPFKITLTPAQIKAVTAIYDIVEMPTLPAGYAWEYMTACARVTNSTTPYDNTPVIELHVENSSRPQFDDEIVSLLSGGNDWQALRRVDPTAAFTDTFVESDKGQIHIYGSPTVGDGTLTVYGTARIITL